MTAPSTPRTYFYGACVEYVSGESYTTHSCSTAIAVRVLPLPSDLVVDTPTVDHRNPIGGQPFKLNVNVRNKGAGTSATTTLRFYRSADSTIGIDDVEIGSVRVRALSAAATSSQLIELQAFYTPGTYRYGACVGQVLGESDDQNNCSEAVAIKVLSTHPAIDEKLLSTLAPVPRAMVLAFWYWPAAHGSDEIEVRVNLHNNVEMRGRNGLYLIGCTGSRIAGNTYYFGLQTDVQDLTRSSQGKGAIFSRWGERDTSHARFPADGWVESGGYEGQFIGVRAPYEWSAGQYSLRLRAEETDEHGRWFGFYVADSSGSEKWIGSLRFPLVDGVAEIDRTCITALEVYGLKKVKPSAIPYWRVTVDAPTGDGVPAYLGDSHYPGNVENLRNALISVVREDVTFEVGLDYIATWRVQGVITGSEERTGIDITGEGNRKWIPADAEGNFQFVMRPGTYVLKLLELIGSNWHTVGWYDGSGGVANNFEKAYRLTVDGEDIEGLEIKLP